MPGVSGTLHSQEVHAQMLYPRNWCDFETKLLWLRGFYGCEDTLLHLGVLRPRVVW